MTETAEIHPISKKRQKFIELAEKRTSNAIKAIRLIGNLSNRASYEYGETDVRKIASALTAEVEAIKAKMTGPSGRKADPSFKL